MQNILPTFKLDNTKLLQTKRTHWLPHSTDPKTTKLSHHLESQISREEEYYQKFSDNKLPQKEPNIRILEQKPLDEDGPSPLNAVERGVADVNMIVPLKKQPSLLSKPIPNYEKMFTVNSSLTMRMINTLPAAMDLFIQRKLSIVSAVVHADHQCIRSVAGALSVDQLQESDLISFLCTTTKKSTVLITGRQEVKDFQFNAEDQIGLEVEVQHSRLIIASVLPDCQASEFTIQLDGAELIAVNGVRVLSLDEFRDAMIEAKVSGRVILKIACYKGGRGKADDIYKDLKKKEQVKTLISNMWIKSIESHDSFDAGDSVSVTLTGDDETSTNNEHDSRCERQIDMDVKVIKVNDLSHPEEANNYSWSPKNHDYHKNDQLGDEDEVLLAKRRVKGSDKLSTQRTNFLENDEGLINRDEGEQRINKETMAAEEDNQSHGSHDSSVGSWNYATADESEIFPFLKLVCVPRALRRSLEWGSPKHFIKISNYSTSWNVTVNWVDETGSLIPRLELTSGVVHTELCSVDHLWAITCTNLERVKKQNNGNQFTLSRAPTSNTVETYTSFRDVESEFSSPTLLLIKPSLSSLAKDKCTAVMWSPWNSLSISYRTQSKQDKKPSSKTMGSESEPNIHVQIFDGRRKNMNSTQQSIATDTDEKNKLNKNLPKSVKLASSLRPRRVNKNLLKSKNRTSYL